MPILGFETHGLFPKATGNTRSITRDAERNIPIVGIVPHSLFSKVTSNTRSSTWAAESNMPLLGLETTQFISDGYRQHVFN